MTHWYYLLPFLLLLIQATRLSANSNSVVEQLPSRKDIEAEEKSEALCLDFLGILIDHLVRRTALNLDEPKLLDTITNSVFTLKHGRLYGLKTVQRTCPIQLSHEEMWRKSGNGTLNQDVNLTEWMQKRDTKLGDLIGLSFCLGIPQNLQLRGSMAVSMFWTDFEPEDVRITLSDISIRVQLQLQLNMTGEMNLDIVSIRVEKLGTIRFEQESPEIGHDGEEKSSGGFMAQYASWADWLANGPLYTPLVIVLETLLQDSFSALLKEKQSSL